MTYKSSSDGNNVELVVCPVLKRDSSLGELFDWVVLDIYDINSLAVELLVVCVLQTRSLDAKVMRHLVWCKQISLPWVPDAIPRLLGPELVRLLVRLRVEQVVLVQRDPVPEPAVAPHALVKGLARLGRVVEGILLIPVVVEARPILLTVAEHLRVEFLAAVLLVGGEVAAAHRDGQIGGPLKDLDGAGLGAPGLYYLHSRGAGANDGCALTLYGDFLLGPERGVVDYTLERFHSFPGGNVALGGLVKVLMSAYFIVISTGGETRAGARDLRIRCREQGTWPW